MKTPKLLLENSRVQVARIEADLSENTFTHQTLALRVAITLDLEPEAGDIAPHIQISPLILPIKSWRDLEGQSWSFPASPQLGLSDGDPVPIQDYGPAVFSIGETHTNYVCTRLEFGEIADRHIHAKITISEAHSQPQTSAASELTANLEIGAIRVVGDVTQANKPDIAMALHLAAPLVDLNDFEPKQQGRIVNLCYKM
jgi:hypothetical protein